MSAAPKFRSRSGRVATGFAILFSLLPATGRSTGEADTPEKGTVGSASQPQAVDYVVPDLPASTTSTARIVERWITLKPSLVLIEDYTSFDQDETSRDQVGPQKDQWDVRAARLIFRGNVGTGYKVGFLIAAEYKGFEPDLQETWQTTDVSFSFPLGSPATQLTVGKSKQTFSYEMVGDAANLPQQERVLSPFFVSRDVGVKLSHVFGEAQRMTLSGGVFNDGWVHGDSLSEAGTDVTVRLTGLAVDRPGDRSFLHLGLAGRYVGAQDGTLRFRGRPESNVADNFVDTGTLVADHAVELGAELLWNRGPFSILAEGVLAEASAPESGDPSFSGWYLTGSWVLTGETRPYDRTVGYARRVLPEGRWGAPELVARISHVDLDDGPVHGGSFDKLYLGLDWWATLRWKVGIGWGRTRLDRFDETGTTDSLLTRVQWVF
ncbi:MAG: OprO/OprP family phosphate-selective porin [Thermoanaerobaculia bacterium]